MSILNRAGVNNGNGRVNITNTVPTNSYPLFEQENNGNSYFNDNALKGIQLSSELSNMFFSKKNIDYLQNTIIQTIYSKYKYKISRQSDIELKIIMRSFYLQYSRNQACNLQEQINTLNNMVLKDRKF